MITTLDLCDDCLAFNAGITEQEQDRPYPVAVSAGFQRIIDDNDGADLLISPVFDEETDEVEQHFSWSHCDVCLSRLGGNRYPHHFDIFPRG